MFYEDLCTFSQGFQMLPTPQRKLLPKVCVRVGDFFIANHKFYLWK